MSDTSDTAPLRPRVARALAVSAAAVAAIAGLSAFTAATCYPFSPGSPPRVAVAAAIWVGVVLAATAVWSALLRCAGRPWASALSADALTYLPLVSLWAAVLMPGQQRFAIPLWWCAAGAVGVAKVGLLAGMARAPIIAIAASAAAARAAAVAEALSGIGRALAPFALIALAARWRIMHLYDGLATPEEGLLAHAAQAILAGEILYRDLRSVFPPGAPYLHAGAFAAFGSTLAAGKVPLGLGPVLMPLAVYYVSHRMMPAAMAFLAAALVGVTGEASVAAFLALCGVGVGFARSGDRRANWVLAGMLTALAAAFDLVLGAAAAAGLVVMLMLRQEPLVMRRIGPGGADLALGTTMLGPFAIGQALVWAPIVAYFALRGALWAMGMDLLAGARGEVFHVLRPAPGVWMWAPAAIYAAVGGLLLVRLVSRRLAEADFIALTITTFGAIAWAWSWRTGDGYHLALSAPPAYMLSALMFGWAVKAVGQSLVGWPPWDHLRVVRAGVVVLVTVGAALPLAEWTRAAMPNLAQMARERELVTPPEGWQPLDLGPAGGVYMPAQEARVLTALVDYLDRHSLLDEPILCAPGRPAIYFLAERPHATRLDYVWAGQASAGEMAEAVVEVHSRKLRLVVLASAAYPWHQELVVEPLLVAHLERNYLQVARFGEYEVLLRRGASSLPTPPPREEPGPPPGPAPPPSMFGPTSR